MSGRYHTPHAERTSLSFTARSQLAYRIATFFPHRRNRDGSFNSICLTCLITVAANMTEEQLIEVDKHHICDVSALSRKGKSDSSEINRLKLSYSDLTPPVFPLEEKTKVTSAISFADEASDHLAGFRSGSAGYMQDHTHTTHWQQGWVDSQE
jgi:hypothetical protein